jgi:nicotinate-nucleotide pyrophosphorylase (carboxylating)
MLDLDALAPLLRAALAEDLGPGDVTSGLLVPADAKGVGRIRAKAEGVVAGIAVAGAVFRHAAGEVPITVEPALEDGARVRPGDPVLAIRGPARVLLAGERTGARILDTRKTTPGLRVLERFAVRMGGGENHRFALYDAVLVKENHLAFKRDLAAALAARPKGMPAIVEAENLAEYRAAVAAGADVVMLDEWTPGDVRRARQERGSRDRPLLEISGGINLGNIRDYAEAGAERISIGALTHSAPALDLSMRVEPL